MADEQTGEMIDILRKSPEGRAHLENVMRAYKEYAEKDYKKGRQNNGFTQVTNKAWDAMRALVGVNKTAAQLYMFLAQHCDKTGVVVVGQAILMEELGCARNTLWRACKELEDRNCLVRLKVSGNTYAYCLDPFQIWKSFASSKHHAAFLTRTLVSNPNAAERRITMMMKKQAMANSDDDEKETAEENDDQQDQPFHV